VVKKNANPVYAPKDATFDFPIYLSLANKLGAFELVVWGKDMLKKEYLGEAALHLADWFGDDHTIGFDDNGNQVCLFFPTSSPLLFFLTSVPSMKPITLHLVSTRHNTHVTGSVHVKVGFVSPPQSETPVDFPFVFSELNKRSRPSLVSAPPVGLPPPTRSLYYP
jgi:phosphatidylserine decarboxylase